MGGVSFGSALRLSGAKPRRGVSVPGATGVSGLVYEMTWQKYLAILLGSHAEATSAVLGIVLAGLAVGYALFGRVTRRRFAGAATARRSLTEPLNAALSRWNSICAAGRVLDWPARPLTLEPSGRPSQSWNRPA